VPAGNVEGDIHYVPDANKTQPLRVVALTLRIAYLLLRVNPQQVITTGAAPGCVAVLLARLLGKPVIFIDSIANADTISLSGRIACRAGVTTLTQWPHLAESRRVLYVGNVFGETP
jgi:UDP-N-acetylglucosamine:LPS N-acetylglucosamine transferase